MSLNMWAVKHRFPFEKELCSGYRAGRNIFLLSGWSEQLDNMDGHMDCNGQLTSILSEAVVWRVLFSLAFLQAESGISTFTTLPPCFHLCICTFRMTTKLNIVKKPFLDGVLSSPFIYRHLSKHSRTLNKIDKNKLIDIAVVKKGGGLQDDSQGEYGFLNRWLLRCDLKIAIVSMLPTYVGRGFRRHGTDQLKVLDPMVDMCAWGIVRLMEVDHLRDWLGVFMWMDPVRYGGLWRVRDEFNKWCGVWLEGSEAFG